MTALVCIRSESKRAHDHSRPVGLGKRVRRLGNSRGNNIRSVDTPRVADDARVRMTQVSRLFAKIKITVGFMETPNIPKALAIARKQGWQFDIYVFLSVAPGPQTRRALRNAALAGPSIYRACEIL